ncbi:peptidase G2 autoproteolytic cleavage domain-containing protein [Priestia megaterium]|uniref:peptidase G2 autoproteolytic cleavage domain-containing protein n=1 Tax=Priestia megaterium TaxID=1404 RepID=UPI00203E2ACD|nr:peptidase G2 autoproteolytic cleavage domain-containing protein [Priestia megaterium]MCM3197165.1 hypothetical protein [Priestia megaterium]
MSNGCNQNPIGACSRANGHNTTAGGTASHAEGVNTIASGIAAYAEGISTIASGDISHTEGYNTKASGLVSHTEGTGTVASSNAAHAEGAQTNASGMVSHAEGASTLASGIAAHAEGTSTIASGDVSHAEGTETIASGDFSHTEGAGTTASGLASHAEGNGGTASGIAAHAEGAQTNASGMASHAEGNGTTTNGFAAHAEGLATHAQGDLSHTEGLDTTVPADFQNSHIMGRFGDANESNSWFIGNGTSSIARGIGAKWSGSTFNMFIEGMYLSPEADYAELFETVDGNQIDVGYFVTVVEEGKIRKATTNDHFILGITSATPSLLGNSAGLSWKEKYLTDEWGRKQYHKVTIPGKKDEKGNILIPEKQEMQPTLNPKWNANTKYIPRIERPEWVAVGLLGQVLVRDDGTCEEQGYCLPNDKGVATKSKKGYLVLKRTGLNQVLVLITPIQKPIKYNLIKRMSSFINNLKNKVDTLLERRFNSKNYN